MKSRAFILVLVLVLAGTPAIAPGCSFLQRGAQGATQKDETGESALSRFLKAVPGLVINPADPEGWGKAIGLVIAFLGSALGLKKLKSMKVDG